MSKFWDKIKAGGKGLLKAIPFVGEVVEGVDNVRSIAVKNAPSLEDEVVVEVVGQPGSSKQQLYYLALATANGIVRQKRPLIGFNLFAGPVYGILQIEYDAASNWVRCKLGYHTSTFDLSAGGDSELDNFRDLAVYNGPQCEVVGDKLNFTASSAGAAIFAGIPASSFAPGIPTLPFEKRTILTNCPTVIDPIPNPVNNPPVRGNVSVPGSTINTPNPKPPGDNRSRGAIPSPVGLDGELHTGEFPTSQPSVGQGGYMTGQPMLDNCCPMTLKLIPLVISALSDPGSFGKEVYTPPTTGPKGI